MSIQIWGTRKKQLQGSFWSSICIPMIFLEGLPMKDLDQAKATTTTTTSTTSNNNNNNNKKKNTNNKQKLFTPRSYRFPADLHGRSCRSSRWSYDQHPVTERNSSLEPPAPRISCPAQKSKRDTPRKINGWNLRIRAPWKFGKSSSNWPCSGSMLIFGGVNTWQKKPFMRLRWQQESPTVCNGKRIYKLVHRAGNHAAMQLGTGFIWWHLRKTQRFLPSAPQVLPEYKKPFLQTLSFSGFLTLDWCMN